MSAINTPQRRHPGISLFEISGISEHRHSIQRQEIASPDKSRDRNDTYGFCRLPGRNDVYCGLGAIMLFMSAINTPQRRHPGISLF